MQGFRKALEDGAERPSVHHLKWDISGSCEDPQQIRTGGYEPPEAFYWKDSQLPKEAYHDRALLMTIEAPCRRCQWCLRVRAASWRMWAMREYKLAVRTWFGTLTLRPEEQYRVMLLARRNNPDFDKLDFDAQFNRRHREIGKEITKYLKRLRENSGAALRYILIVEKHKSGLPHYHMLVHETELGKPVLHKQLTAAWRLGFTKWNLATPDRVPYVTKYLMKSALARVRASADYGRRSLSIDVNELFKVAGRKPEGEGPAPEQNISRNVVESTDPPLWLQRAD